MLSATRVRLSTTGGGAAITGSAGTSTKSAAGSASLRRFAAAASTRRSAPVRRRARGGSSYSTAAAFAAASGSSSEKPSSSTVRGAFPASSGASSSSSSEPFRASSGASSSLFSQAASSASSAASRSNSSSSSIAAAILCDAAVACSTSDCFSCATAIPFDKRTQRWKCQSILFATCLAVMSLSRGATAQLQLLLGLPSVLRAASKICTPPRSRREECRRTRRCAAKEWLGGGGDTRLETRERALVQGRKLHDTKHTLLTGPPAAAASSTPASQQSALVWCLRDAPETCPRMRP